MQIIVKMTGDKNPSRKDSLTPLHLAAGKGHIQVCTFIMENLENKNTGNKRGKTPFTMPHIGAFFKITGNMKKEIQGMQMAPIHFIMHNSQEI